LSENAAKYASALDVILQNIFQLKLLKS